MKKAIIIIFLFCIILFLISCKKDTAAEIVGKWSVVNDSSFLAGTPFLYGGGSNYVGVASDYFYFTSDSNLYIRKGSEYDTAKYSFPSSRQVTFVYFAFNGSRIPTGGIIGPYNIAVLTTHYMTLNLSGLTPAGREFEIINLRK